MRNILLATTACFALSAFQSAVAQDTDFDDEFETIDETVIVTGTRREGRTAVESVIPVDVIGGDVLQDSASDELMDQLTQIAPSFNVQRRPLADGLIFVRPATLRNLRSDHTLVLVNGKRRHRSALLGEDGEQGVDLAQIPTFAIERLEILRDGASAQYGSDAIAGVINIIQDEDPGYSGFVQFSQYYEGDGDQYRVAAKGGFPVGEDGFFVGTFEYTNSDPTSRSRQRPDAIIFQDNNPDLRVPNPVQNWGQPELETYRFFVNSRFAVDETIDFYMFGSYGMGEALSDFNWRNPDGTSAFRLTDVFPDFDLRTIYPTGFTPQFGQDDEDFSGVAGLQGEIGERFTWDVSGSIGRNKIDYKLFDTINASLGPDSPTAFKPGTLLQREENLNANFVYIWDAPYVADSVNIAVGAERRREVYTIRAGDPASFEVGPGAVAGLPSGSNGFPGYTTDEAGSFDQVSYAGYIDIDVPMTDKLTVAVAGRFEDFSEFGSSNNGKVSARYDINDMWAVRASFSTGFRAPTPGQLESTRTSQGLDTVTLDIFTNGRLSPSNPVAQAFGAQPLEAEESENYSAGVVFQWENLTATLDIYQIDIDDRLAVSQTFTIDDATRAELIAQGVPGAESFTRINFFTNDLDTRTRGIDFVATYGTPLFNGDLALSAAYNYNDTEVRAGRLANDELNRTRFEEGLPNHAANISARYDHGRFHGFARVRYFGSWTDSSGQPTGDIFQEFGSEILLDLALTVDINDLVGVDSPIYIRAGAENIFDNTPDEATFQANRGLIYSRNSPYDFSGGLYYIRIGGEF